MYETAKRLAFGSLIIAASLAGGAAAHADAVSDFYKGKSLSMVTSTGAGGPYDIAARAVSRYIVKYIPGNPTIVVKNMPGAGHVLATNYMYNLAEKDGTYMATLYNGIPMHQVLDGKGVRFDARKFNWLGSTGTNNLVTMVWHTTPVRTAQDLLTKEVIAGSTGAGSGTMLYPAVMNAILGTKFKIVSGYRDSPELDLAMERGEVQSRSGGSYAGFVAEHMDWVKDKKVIFLLQVGGEREKELADIPLMSELATNDDQKQLLKFFSSQVALGRMFLTTPDVPADRVAALRAAFASTMQDKDFIAEANKFNMEYGPISAERITQIVNETINVSPELLDKAKSAMASAN